MRRHLRKWPARPRRTARFPRFSTHRSRWMPNSCKADDRRTRLGMELLHSRAIVSSSALVLRVQNYLAYNHTPARLTTEATGEQTASSERVELVVPALRHPIRFCLVAPTVQQG